MGRKSREKRIRRRANAGRTRATLRLADSQRDVTPGPVAGSSATVVGITDSERHLSRLCRRTFLSLWSHPNVYRDQGQLDWLKRVAGVAP